MNKQFTIQEELKELNSSLPLLKTPYQLPEGYFDHLAVDILSKIKVQENLSSIEELEALSPLLAALPKKMPFSVPGNYFSQTLGGLSDLVQEDTLPADLQQINRKMPYEVPSGYFDHLPAQILASVAKPKAKVIAFNRTKWMRYAAAAVITGFLAFGSIFYFNGNSSIDPIKHPHQWIASKLKNVSNQDLENFIQTTEPVTNDQQQIAQSYSTHGEVHAMLNDVSTSDLKNFLSEVPGENDTSVTLN